MSETKLYIQKLFSGNNITIAANRLLMFEEFVADETNINAVKQIQDNQKSMMDKWQLKNKITDIIQQSVSIPNATVGKEYHAKIDFLKLGWNDIVFSDFESLDKYGLSYDNESKIIKGIPSQSGEFKIKMLFRINGEAEESPLNGKLISLIINADPKSLWKNITSDKEDPYWKEDNLTEFQPLGSRHIVVSSKRGRSHANVGSFRDDDYACKYFENTGWSVIAVSDGAGSAKLSRKGSELACKSIVHYFENSFTEAISTEFDVLVTAHQQETLQKDETAKTTTASTEEQAAPVIAATGDTLATDENTPPDNIAQNAPVETVIEKVETTSAKISKFIYNHLGNAARSVHKELEDFAAQKKINIKDLHSTLIFALYKKYSFGYVVLSFGVGDCPIGLLNKDLTALKLMNWLDVGEFGGGTRFITMPEIFTSEKFSTRFGFKLIEDFSYLILMTDGIYDPKFVVEANLEKVEKWQAFIADLKGNNEDAANVVMNTENEKITDQLSAWMDFWSPGNHDDRTLAIVF